MIKKDLVFVAFVLFVAAGLAPSVSTADNLPPSNPIINGPVRVNVGTESIWGFISTDPEEENITYYVDWGDVCGGAKWYGPYTSSEEIEIGHTYTYKNTLIINAMAVDEQGAESNMTYFEVTIQRSRTTLLFIQLFEQFPHAFTILRHLLKI